MNYNCSHQIFLNISENSVPVGSSSGSVIGRLAVKDDDAEQTHTFELGGQSTAFQISSAGEVSVKDISGLSKGSFVDLQVVAKDNGEPQLQVS